MNARVTPHSSAQEARALTPHHANAFVMQIPPARVFRRSITLHASVNAILSKNVVRAESLMRTHVAAFVRMHKNAQLVTFLIRSHVNACAKEEYLRTSGIIDIVTAGEITTRSLTSLRVAANVLGHCSAGEIELLIQKRADVCVRNCSVSVQRR